jgi:hypothetical protein
MIFQVAVNSGLSTEGYGPFEYESVCLTKEIRDKYKNGLSLPRLYLDPVVASPNIRPTYVLGLSQFIFILKSAATNEEIDFLSDSIMTEAEISGWGGYYMLYGPKIESKFVKSIDPSRSEFEVVRRSSMTLTSQKSLSAIKKITGIDDMDEIFRSKPRPILDVIVISKAHLLNRWRAGIFVLDNFFLFFFKYYRGRNRFACETCAL